MTGPISSSFARAIRETVWFYQDDVAAGQSAVALTCFGDAARTEYPMNRQGSITGIILWSNEGRTADTAVADATINGSATALQATLDSSNTTVDSATQDKGADAFTASQRIGVKLTTGGSWTPTTADIIVGVEVTYDA